MKNPATQWKALDLINRVLVREIELNDSSNESSPKWPPAGIGCVTPSGAPERNHSAGALSGSSVAAVRAWNNPYRNGLAG